MVLFQCQLYHFQHVMGCNPMLDFREDQLLLSYIKRANLDALWSCTSSIVHGNCSQVQHILGYCFVDIFPLQGPFSMGDAVTLLKRSLDPGRNARYVHYHTTRKLQSAFEIFGMHLSILVMWG